MAIRRLHQQRCDQFLSLLPGAGKTVILKSRCNERSSNLSTSIYSQFSGHACILIGNASLSRAKRLVAQMQLIAEHGPTFRISLWTSRGVFSASPKLLRRALYTHYRNYNLGEMASRTLFSSPITAHFPKDIGLDSAFRSTDDDLRRVSRAIVAQIFHKMATTTLPSASSEGQTKSLRSTVAAALCYATYGEVGPIEKSELYRVLQTLEPTRCENLDAEWFTSLIRVPFFPGSWVPRGASASHRSFAESIASAVLIDLGFAGAPAACIGDHSPIRHVRGFNATVLDDPTRTIIDTFAISTGKAACYLTHTLGWALVQLKAGKAVASQQHGSLQLTSFPEDGIPTTLSEAKAAICETLRLHPPVATLTRVVDSDDLAHWDRDLGMTGRRMELDNAANYPDVTELMSTKAGQVVLPSSAVVALSIEAMHRRPDLWLRPQSFDASRFLPAKRTEGPGGSALGPLVDDSVGGIVVTDKFLPFGIGPSACPVAAAAEDHPVIQLCSKLLLGVLATANASKWLDARIAKLSLGDYKLVDRAPLEDEGPRHEAATEIWDDLWRSL